MSVDLGPNIEALVGKWLREHPDVAALGAHVAGRVPDSTVGPWVRVTLLTAPTDSRSGLDYLITYVVQLDCYAGKAAMDAHTGQVEAWALKATCRAALNSVEGASMDGVVVSRVAFTGDLRAPDATLGEPARERFILEAELTVHST